MSNSPHQFSGLQYVKECNLVEAWHEFDFDDVRYIFMRDFDGVLCRVRVDEVVNDEGCGYDLYIANRHDLGVNVDVCVYVYQDVMRDIRNLLQGIESALRSAWNMDVHLNGIIATLEQDRDKRSHLERAEQLGYKAMQAIDAFKQNELEKLLGVENGRKLFYAASAVRSRTYQALDGSQSIFDIRIFIYELLALIELPKFPTPPPATKGRYAVYNDNLYGHFIEKKGIEHIKDECIAGWFDDFGDATTLMYKISKGTTDKIVVYDCQTREWAASVEPSPASDDFVEYDTDDDGSELLHWNGNDLVPVELPEGTMRLVENGSVFRETVEEFLSDVSPIVESDSFAGQIYDTDSDWVREGLQNSLDARTQETYQLGDEIKVLKKQLEDLHNIGAAFEQFRTRYAQEWNEWKVERRTRIKDAFDAKYSLSLANGEITSLKAALKDATKERDDWKLCCESAKLELMEAKRRADDARQETLRWKDAYAASEESNKKLFYQRHKLAKQLVRRRHPRVVTLLK